jgi:hypothetical protein
MGATMGFFQTFWSWLSGQLAGYIGDNTALVASALEPAVVTLAVIYVIGWGYLHLIGRIDEPFATGLKRIVLLAVILAVALRLWLYNAVIVDTFYNAPAQLAAAVIGGSDPVGTIDVDQGRRHRVGLLPHGCSRMATCGIAVCLCDVPDRTVEHRIVTVAGDRSVVRRHAAV